MSGEEVRDNNGQTATIKEIHRATRIQETVPLVDVFMTKSGMDAFKRIDELLLTDGMLEDEGLHVLKAVYLVAVAPEKLTDDERKVLESIAAKADTDNKVRDEFALLLTAIEDTASAREKYDGSPEGENIISP